MSKAPLLDNGPSVLGNREPRVFTPPLRPLTPETTRGYEVIEFARDVLQEPLLPWQEEVVLRALELRPDGRYRFKTVLVLVSRQNGKSHLSRVIALWKMYVDGARLVLGVAQDLSIAREVWQGAVDTAQSLAELRQEITDVRRVNGEQELKIASGARYKISAATRSAGRGLTVDHLTLDEIREHRNFDAWSALSKTTIARPNSQIWCISNAGDRESVVLNHLRDAALSSQDSSIGIFEWSAPDGCPLDDIEAWKAANPALGVTITLDAIRGALATDTPSTFRTEVLCQRVDALDAAIDAGAWESSHDPAGSMESLRDQVVACLDVAPDGNHATLVAAASTGEGRTYVEVIEAWSSTEEVRHELPELLRRVNPRTFAWFPTGPAAALAPELRQIPNAVELTGAKVAEACQGFADLVHSRRVTHPGDPLLDAHVTSATKFTSGDGWRFVRRGVGHVDAAYAAAGAVYALHAVPVEAPAPRSKVF